MRLRNHVLRSHVALLLAALCFGPLHLFAGGRLGDFPRLTRHTQVELEFSYLLQQHLLLNTANTAWGSDETKGDVTLQERCLLFRPEHRRLVETALALAQGHPHDAYRWDAVVLGVENLIRYRYFALWDENGVPWSDYDHRNRIPDQRDPFKQSPSYGQLLTLWAELLDSEGIKFTTYAQAANRRIQWLKEGDYPSWNHLVQARFRGDDVDSQMEHYLEEVRQLLEKMEKRIPADGVASLTGSREIWSIEATGYSVDIYARMLGRLRTPRQCLAEMQRLQRSQIPAVAKKSAELAAKMQAQPLDLNWRPFSTLDGKTIDLRDLRGKVVLLHFWSAAKEGLGADISELKAAYAKFHDAGFEIIGVSLDHASSRDSVKAACRREEIPWPQRFEGIGPSDSIVAELGIIDVPARLLLNKEGALVATRLPAGVLERQIAKQLAEPPFEYGGATELVPYHSEWRYQDSGQAPPVQWTTSPLVSKEWKSGRGALGYGSGFVATMIEYGKDRRADRRQKYPAAYFRRAFEAPVECSGSDFVLNLRVDDGAVIYLNGVEVGRIHMDDGPVTENTLAADYGTIETEVELRGKPGLLRAGRNILAVSVHQKDRSSSDLAFDLRLLAWKKEGATR